MIRVLATGLIDLWQQFLKRGVGLPTANWRLIGRWVAGMSHGVLVHPSIATADAVRGEAAVG